MLHRKHALVAGGAGFIGSHLSNALLAKGYQVTGIDNLITGNRSNLAELEKSKNFRFIEADITKGFDRYLDASVHFDYIYHLASPASPIQYQHYPLETLHANAIGTERLLELTRGMHAKFLFASTSEVYGDPREHPQKETYWGNVNPFGPRSCYDESKRYAEALLYVYIHRYAVDARIVRIFNTYGPNMEENDGRVLSNFISQALHDKPITVYGDGSQTRSFCFVSDMVAGIIAAMEKTDTRGEIFNLGNTDERTIRDIALLVQEITKTKGTIAFKPLPQDDPTRRKPDIEKAKKILAWKPKVMLEDGLAKTIAYFNRTTKRS